MTQFSVYAESQRPVDEANDLDGGEKCPTPVLQGYALHITCSSRKLSAVSGLGLLVKSHHVFKVVPELLLDFAAMNVQELPFDAFRSFNRVEILY